MNEASSKVKAENKKHALVTGASAGIGAALARRLVDAGYTHLSLVARREDRLQALAAELNCSTQIVVADLATAEGLQAVLKAVPETDLLVNNAGIGGFGPFVDRPTSSLDLMIHLNCSTPVLLARHYLPKMVEKGHGNMVVMASAQSFQPIPFMSTYAATKAFLLHWGEGLREELRGTGVHVAVICPGATPTEFNDAGGIPEEDLAVISIVGSSVAQVVEASIGAIERKHTLKLPGFGSWLAVTLGGFGPRALSRWVVGSVLRRAASKRS